ncbi:hypothetical protein OS493_039445, partial [Desmophyllum pertusum]
EYTNSDNPFGDAHLLESFVWHKKREKDGEQHLKEEEMRRREKLRQHEAKEREHEKQTREEERETLQREKEADSFKEWEEQEDQFHLEQAKLRLKLRIQDGR